MKIKARKKYTALLLFTLIVMSAALCRIYYKSFIDKAIWSISIYAGTNPYDFQPHPLAQRNPVWSASDVTDVPAGSPYKAMQVWKYRPVLLCKHLIFRHVLPEDMMCNLLKLLTRTAL